MAEVFCNESCGISGPEEDKSSAVVTVIEGTNNDLKDQHGCTPFGSRENFDNEDDDDDDDGADIDDNDNDVITEALCSICDDEPAISSSQDLMDLYPDCGHSIDFGEQCLRKFVSVKIREHALHGLKCPHTDCIHRFSNEFLTHMTSKEEYMIYDADVQSLVVKDESVFNNSMSIKYCIRLFDAVREALPNLCWRVCVDSKRCPSCRFIIEKHGGCSHMTCRKCGHDFHWCCGQSYRGQHNELVCTFFKIWLPLLVYTCCALVLLFPLAPLILSFKTSLSYLLVITSFYVCGLIGCYLLRDLTNATLSQDVEIEVGMKFVDGMSSAILVSWGKYIDQHHEEFYKKIISACFLACSSLIFTACLSSLGIHREQIEYLHNASVMTLIPIIGFLLLRGFKFDLSEQFSQSVFLCTAVVCTSSGSISLYSVLVYCLLIGLSCNGNFAQNYHHGNYQHRWQEKYNVSLPIILMLMLIAFKVNSFYFWCGVVLSALQTLCDPICELPDFSWAVTKNPVISTSYFLIVCALTASSVFSPLNYAWWLQCIPKVISMYFLLTIETSLVRLSFENIIWYNKHAYTVYDVIQSIWGNASTRIVCIIYLFVYGVIFVLSYDWIMSSVQNSLTWLLLNLILDMVVDFRMGSESENMFYKFFNRNRGVQDTRLMSYVGFLAIPILKLTFGAIFQLSMFFCIPVFSLIALGCCFICYAYFSYVR
jgi:hypothetical protein